MAGALSAACGGGRKAAATQKTVVAFNPAKSDAKAVAAVDAMLAALGGQAQWDKAKQISWDLKYTLDGQLKAWFRHTWDKWNGRHRFEMLSLESYAKAKAAGDDKLRKWYVVMYDLFDHDNKGYAEYMHKPVSRKDVRELVARAHKRWMEDHYQLAFHYKLKDPGVILKSVGTLDEKNGQGVCKPSCDTIKVTFEASVGSDTYYININSKTKLPEIVEKQSANGRLGYILSDWISVGGMKFPGKLQNIGNKGEIFTISNVKVSEPDDFLFVPRARP